MPDEIGRVDDEHVRIVEIEVERSPASLQQDRVACLAMSNCLAQAVAPVFSSAVLTMNRLAIKMTADLRSRRAPDRA
jgi:hypothetical protein